MKKRINNKKSLAIILMFISSWLFSQENISGLWVAYPGSVNEGYSILYLKQDSLGNIKGITYEEQDQEYGNNYLDGRYFTFKHKRN